MGATAERLADFGPGIDKEAMFELDRIAASNDVGVNRRVTLGVLTMSAKALVGAAVSDSNTFKEMALCVGRFRAHAQGLVELAKVAEARLSVASGIAAGAPSLTDRGPTKRKAKRARRTAPGN